MKPHTHDAPKTSTNGFQAFKGVALQIPLCPVLYRLLALLSVFAVTLPASIPTHAQDEINEIFSWATPTTPGCAVAVSHQGEVVVNRVYGSADLERGVPITPSTTFDIGSVQKQFTAASVLLLVEEGRLSLSDDVRTHVPELPDYGHTITLDHLLTHTSGIRDWPGMLPMAADDPHVLTFILRQRGLNFAPGEEWSYSTSGYELLKEIVARTSGMSFSDFTRTRLFEPLGMSSTEYRQDMRADIENLALGYDRDGDGWKVDMLLGNDRGGGALLSTATDLLTWHEALTGGHLGEFVTEKIQEPATLNNGRKLNYARALYVDADRDGKRVWHTGGAAGYSTFLGGYPERGLSIATTCNLDGGSSRAAAPVLNLFLPPMSDESADGDGTQAANADGAVEGVDLSGREGLFFSEEAGRPLRLVVNDGRLSVVGGRPLEAVASEHFRNPRGALFFMSQDEFELRFLSQDELALTSMEGKTTRYRRARDWAPTPAELSAFAGRYESDELGAVYQIEAGEGVLVARAEHMPDRTVEFTPVDRDTFMMRMMMMSFHRDEAGKVVGFDHSTPVFRDLRFTRLSDGTDQLPPQASASAASAVDPESERAPAGPEALVGFYEAAPGRGITISLEGGTLYGEPTGQEKAQFVPQSGTTYYVGRKGAPMTATFTVGADGQATTLVLRRGNGTERTFPRVR